MRKIRLVVLCLLVICTSLPLFSQIHIDLEGGVVGTGYNDVRIPGDTGTMISFSDELEAEITYFYRIRAGYTFAPKHYVSLLVAPLTVESSGRPKRSTDFQGTSFPASSKLNATFMFNSYRLTYRYYFYSTEKLLIGAGITGKIRHAAITIEDNSQKAEKTNVGFVPLINFSLLWNFSEPMSLLFEWDALAAPQGRAEDVLLALQYRLNETVSLRAGYRLLEGGADNDEVYTFSMFHYGVLGVQVTL